MSMSTLETSSTQQSRPTLRRATYVHVSDLTSAYNIDHARLEQELSRVKAERDLHEESVTADRHAKKPREDDTGEEGTTAADLEIVLPQKRLQPPRGGYNLCVLVGNVNVVVDKKRVDQSRVRLAEVEVGDETGIVSLRARDEQIDMLEEVSQRNGAVVLRNCTLELYQGRHIRLAVTKWGKLSTYPDNVASTPPPPSKMNVDRNFSLIDLSIVASEMVDTFPSSSESRYGGRQSKGAAENDQGGNGPGSSKSGQLSTPKQQQTPSSRRSNKPGERRQSRGKTPPGGPMTVHYAGIKHDSRQQQSQPGQVMYHPMPGFPTYEQSMGMRHYPHTYAHASRPDVSAQQMMLQQQYELQQRQLQQMYGQDHHRQGHQVQQAPQIMIRHMESFETGSSPYQGDLSDQHQVPLMSGASPLMMPMGLPPGQTMAQASHEHYPSPALDSRSAPPEGSNPSQRASGAVSPYNIGKMNPDASSYTPSYLSAAQGQPPQQHSTPDAARFAYDYSQSQGVAYPPPPGHYPGFYTPAGINPGTGYSPAHQSSGVASDSSKGRQQAAAASPGTTDSTQSGKENVTSKK
ncbi:hypothetical protein IV203_000919 [Nitzschia inconspicua]|uniref:Single-stranded DNA binding protein Ssb-like OB fold domain-containing protein n=1 Tax=Nitzschia inconspicua TaxID=303405 RepID=A0A9K3PR56_9STRA|nr:hypothetical protein IV203_000919 [Nitzschia inconspicua]